MIAVEATLPQNSNKRKPVMTNMVADLMKNTSCLAIMLNPQLQNSGSPILSSRSQHDSQGTCVFRRGEQCQPLDGGFL